MSEYIMIYNYGTCSAECSDCSFAGKTIAEFDDIDELQRTWCKAIYDGKDVNIYKRMQFKITEM